MIILLILLQAIHWLGDYTHLSTNKMLESKRFGKPLTPILQHAFIHGLGVFIILGILGYPAYIAFLMFLLMWGSHFIIDVWKGKMNVWFPKLADPTNKFHWYIFGLDQMFHQFIIILIAYLVI